MLYVKFKKNLLTELKDYFTEDISLTIIQVLKYNQTKTDALKILDPKIQITPTIYLKQYFLLYQWGISIRKICKHIITYYESCCSFTHITPDLFHNYSNIKNHIVYQLIHYEKNKKLLTELPHFRFHDLAVIFYFFLAQSTQTSATLLITKEHLQALHISPDILYSDASINTPLLLTHQLSELEDVLASPCKAETTPNHKNLSQAFPMYVLTNSYKLNGAACILYNNLLKDIAATLDSSFFILPCSIHEVILVPVQNNDSAKLFHAMVLNANLKDIPNDEILSDHAYFYDKSKEQIL